VANTTNVNKPAPGAIGAVEEADSAARTALKLSSKEPNARLAQIELQRTTLDLAKTEDALRGVLATNPSNIFAMRQLWNLLQSAGRSRDALAVVQRAMTIKPLAATVNFPLAQLLWIIGRVSEADRVIDRALDYWPEHRWVRFARFSIFAFTGRARTALAMLDSDSRPQSFSAESVALWRICLEALDDPSAPNISRTRKATLDATKQNPSLTSQSILTLSALGQVDPAFAIANNFLQFLAPDAEKPAGGRRASSTAWRFTPWLFTPPAAAMRKDPRFNILTDGIGLSAYWSERKLRPDYQIYE
jgi:tetratricopeptide (TPR) repeat protein